MPAHKQEAKGRSVSLICCIHGPLYEGPTALSNKCIGLVSAQERLITRTLNIYPRSPREQYRDALIPRSRQRLGSNRTCVPAVRDLRMAAKSSFTRQSKSGKPTRELSKLRRGRTSTSLRERTAHTVGSYGMPCSTSAPCNKRAERTKYSMFRMI